MSKTVVFITGTNGVGKSTLAWAIIERCGGVDRIEGDVTYCNNGMVSLAGRYIRKPYGGVDSLNCTSTLAGICEDALRKVDVVVCEGSFMNSFGMNLTNAIFKGEKQIVMSLYTDRQTIYNRLTMRSNGVHGKGGRAWSNIFNKQKQAMVAARKWQSIGVKVLQVDTAKMSVQEQVDLLLNNL